MIHLTSRSIIVFSLLVCAIARADDRPVLPTIPAQIKSFIDKKEIAGAVTLVASRDKILHYDATGLADIEGNKPMQPDSIFWIASMTKPMAGVAILMLQDEGKLNLNDPVAKYIPQLKDLKTPSGQPANLTIKHLATHTSGLAEATSAQSRAAKTLADLIPHFAAKPTSFEPGSKWQYCQSGINTLGRIVEVVSGQSFPEFLASRLTGPLGMKDTTFYLSEAQLPRLATSYRKTADKLDPAAIGLLNGKSPTDRDRYPAANGGLFSTALDYARFCQMLLNNGTLDGKQYLKPETVKLLSTILTEDLKTGFTDGNGWGVAVCIIKNPQGITAMLSPGSYGHGGAYGTQAWIDPVKGRAYILMTQRANFPNSDASDLRKSFQQAAADALK